MGELGLKGPSKRRLIIQLAERYNDDKKTVLFKVKRAFITDRYEAEHH